MTDIRYSTVAVAALVAFAVGYICWELIKNGSVTIYPDELSAMRGEQDRSERFREKCAHVGFTSDQCIFFQKGADAP